MSDIKIIKLNNIYGRVLTDDIGLLEAMFRRFAVRVLNYFYMPHYRAGKWDGKIHFVERSGKFYLGHLDKILKYVQSECKNIEIDPAMKGDAVNKDELLKDFAQVTEERINPEFIPRHYQVRGALKALYHKRGIIEHCTGSGKSLTISLVCNYLLWKNPSHRIMLLVPSISLVDQMRDDMVSYGIPPDLIGKFYGYEKNLEPPIVVSTWQSMMNAPQLAKLFTAILVDECLHPDTLITMWDGSQKPIKDIVIGEKVKTLNEITGCIEEKPVIKLHKNLSKNNRMFCITLENGKTLKITGNHKVMLKNGTWKKAEDLCIEDDIMDL